MGKGVLQDDPSRAIRAELDIRDNPIPRDSKDGYAALRPYWENIYDRVPFTLPEISKIAAPSFSLPGGFYAQDIMLEISVSDPHVEIHYTLDGSQPTLNSPIYNGPLHISQPPSSPDDLSMNSETSSQWVMPREEIFKGTIVRAKAFDASGAYSHTSTESFFITPKSIERYSIPVVSLTADPSYLFDKDQGIYVFGRMIDTYDGQIDQENANFHQRGGQWERPIHVDYFDASGLLQFSSEGGVSIHGATTRGYPQKSLKIMADNWYGDGDHFENKIFPNISDAISGKELTEIQSFLLRNSGNHAAYPIFRSTVMQELFSNTSLDTFGYQMVVVFINGEYWGIYNMRETSDEDFLAAHYQQSPDDFTILERNAQLNFGSNVDQVAYTAMLDFIRDNDITVPENYAYIKTMIDIDNYIDYQIAEIYVANRNWPHDNIKYWRYRADEYDPSAPEGLDGRWRWLLFDLDTGYGYGISTGADDNTLERAIGEFLFRSLLENEEFRTAFINRFADHLNTILTAENVKRVVDQSESDLLPEISEHIARWQIAENSVALWRENVDIMRSFSQQRPEFLYQNIQDFFDLSGLVTVTVTTNLPGGTVRVNSVNINSSTLGVRIGDNWTGKYFKDIPIRFSAIPMPGYKFSGWVGTEWIESDKEMILTEDISLTAIFDLVD